MFHVKIKLGKSNIHGIGLFANQNISKGQLVYSINKKLDLIVSKNDFSELSKDEQSTIKHYGYFNKKDDLWHLAFDDMKFCNHSLDGNIFLDEDYILAKKYILNGEELTQDYSEFEDLREDLR